MNHHEIIDQFRAAMASAGMVTHDALIADGVLHRVYVEGDKPGTKNGAYILHLNGRPAGYFEYFPISLKQTWTLSGKREPLSLCVKKQIESERKRRSYERKQRQMEATEKAKAIWQKANPVSSIQSHAYLVKKRVKPFSLRISRGSLLVPIYSEARDLVNLQFIDAAGNKRFLAGGKKKECFSVIGCTNSHDLERLLICEGWATGASLHEELGVFVMVAMDAGNLAPVAHAARRLFPDAEIIIAGDNDESGTGQAAAQNAALAIGGKVLIPQQSGVDWNDILTMDGAA